MMVMIWNPYYGSSLHPVHSVVLMRNRAWHGRPRRGKAATEENADDDTIAPRSAWHSYLPSTQARDSF